MRTLHRISAGLFALALATALVACGDDDDNTSTTTAEETTTTAGAEEPATVEVIASDYTYTGLPDALPAGSTLTLTNEATEELHELVAFRLPDDEARSAEELVALPESELGQLFSGEPATVLLAPPGGAPQIEAVGDGTLAEPGRYLVLCSIPIGADPEAYLNAPPGDGPPDVPGGLPHFTEGMFAELTVE